MDELPIASTLWTLFLRANSFRETSGGAHDLRTSSARQLLNSQSDVGEVSSVKLPDDAGVPEPWCGCGEAQSCDICEAPLKTVCAVNDTINWCTQHNPFDGLGHKLSMVKVSDYTDAADSYYAPVGNRPAKLKANPVNEEDVTAEDMQEAAATFYAYIQDYLDQNEVTVDEIPIAFNFVALADLVDQLSDTAVAELQDRLNRGLNKAEDRLEAVFNRTRLMQEYIQVLDDTAHNPIGVLWFDEAAMVCTTKAGKSGVQINYDLRPTVNRVDPCKVWFTPDWTINREGRAVFTCRQYTAADVTRATDAMPSKLKSAAKKLIDDNPHGYRMRSAQLFTDGMPVDDGLYDVLVCRGTFSVDELKDVGLTSEDKMEHMPYAELWYSNGEVIFAKLLPAYLKGLGVYTTSFRTFGDSIWGISLYDFVHPFARLYEGAVKGVDTSVGKSTGSIISLDIGVIDNPDSFITKNPATGAYEIDLSGDNVIKFDSTDAAVSPNWKGVPLQIDQMPTDLPNLIPAINLALQQIEIISGIPSILTTGSPQSSAVRTDGAYDTAHETASKKVKSLLKRPKERVLMPVIMAFYLTLVDKGLLKGLPVDTDPELLMDERLTNHRRASRNFGQILNDLAPFADRVPVETMNDLINQYVTQAYDLDDDVIEGGNPVDRSQPAQAPGSV